MTSEDLYIYIIYIYMAICLRSTTKKNGRVLPWIIVLSFVDIAPPFLVRDRKLMLLSHKA